MKTIKIHDDAALKAAVARCQRAGIEGRFNVGPGLTCVVTEAGRARFVHRYPYAGKYESIWFDGTYPRDVTLGEARQACEAHRKLLDERINPKDVRDTGLKADPTLAEYARANFEALATPQDRKVGPERSDWLREMTVHVGALADMKIDSVLTTQIASALKHRWKGNVPTPTAMRLMMRLRVVLRHRHSTTRPDDRQWQNPCDIEVICDMHGRERHHRKAHASLPFPELPAFMVKLRANELMSARALEWVILTGCRANESAGALWGEIDWSARTWTIPVWRLKTEQNKPAHIAKPFVVPLSLGMVQLLRRVRANREDLGPDDLIFPSASYRGPRVKARKSYKLMSLLLVAQGIVPEITTHGFRASLMAWGVSVAHRDRDHFALDLMDRVLGHQIGSKESGLTLSGAIGSYAHGSGQDIYFVRRRIVMREWSAFLGGRTHSPKKGEQPEEVVALKRAA